MIIILRELPATTKLLAELEYSRGIPRWLAQAQWIAMNPKLYWRLSNVENRSEAMILSEKQKKEQRAEFNKRTLFNYNMHPSQKPKSNIIQPANRGELAKVLPFKKKES